MRKIVNGLDAGNENAENARYSETAGIAPRNTEFHDVSWRFSLNLTRKRNECDRSKYRYANSLVARASAVSLLDASTVEMGN